MLKIASSSLHVNSRQINKSKFLEACHLNERTRRNGEKNLNEIFVNYLQVIHMHKFTVLNCIENTVLTAT